MNFLGNVILLFTSLWAIWSVLPVFRWGVGRIFNASSGNWRVGQGLAGLGWLCPAPCASHPPTGQPGLILMVTAGI